MIPLSTFLLPWMIFLALFVIIGLISILQMLRYGIAGSGTYLSILLFLLISMAVVLGVGSFLIRVDWSQSVNMFDWIRNLLPF